MRHRRSVEGQSDVAASSQDRRGGSTAAPRLNDAVQSSCFVRLRQSRRRAFAVLSIPTANACEPGLSVGHAAKNTPTSFPAGVLSVSRSIGSRSSSMERAVTLRSASSSFSGLILVASTAIGQTRNHTGSPNGAATICLSHASSQALMPSIATDSVSTESWFRSARTLVASSRRSRGALPAGSRGLGECAQPKRFETLGKSFPPLPTASKSPRIRAAFSGCCNQSFARSAGSSSQPPRLAESADSSARSRAEPPSASYRSSGLRGTDLTDAPSGKPSSLVIAARSANCTI